MVAWWLKSKSMSTLRDQKSNRTAPTWKVIISMVKSTHCKCYGLELLQWRHNGCDAVSNHQPHDCLLNRCPVNSSHKRPVTRKMFPLDDVIMAWTTMRLVSFNHWGTYMTTCSCPTHQAGSAIPVTENYFKACPWIFCPHIRIQQLC